MQNDYRQKSIVANLYQHVIDFDNYCFNKLSDDLPLFDKIHRQTKSIRAIIRKHLDD